MINISYAAGRLPGSSEQDPYVIIGRALRGPREGDFDRIEAEIERNDIDSADITIFCMEEHYESRTIELSNGFEARVLGPDDSAYQEAAATFPFSDYFAIYQAEREALSYGMTIKEAALYIIKTCKAYQRVYHVIDASGGRKKRTPGGSRKRLQALLNELTNIRELLDEEFEERQNRSQ